MAIFRKFTQNKLYRFLINVLRIPYIYIILRGHISKKGYLSVDRRGDYIPWFTYPSIDYLENIDLSECNVFEFGSGSSTLWWAKRTRKITSIELEEDWYNYIKGSLPVNAGIHHCHDGGMYPQMIFRFEDEFDIIVIDGAERYKCALNSVNKLSHDGIIILDNSDWYPNTAMMLTDRGFIRIDFYGFSHNNSFPSCTSLFFKTTGFLEKHNRTSKKVIGGNTISGGALDDQ